MIILGLNAHHADSSAAIFRDGILVAATEEERFRRIKHWAGFPSEAVKFCLREAGVSLAEVDHIAIGRDPRAKLLQKLRFLLTNPQFGFRALSARLENRGKIVSLPEQLAAVDGTPAAALAGKMHNIEHHRSHLATAFFASPFEEAAVLSVDGSGDFTSTMIAVGRGHRLEVLDSVDFPVSWGTIYSGFTQFLGFPHYGDEYKVMGLSSYGEPRYVEQVRQLLRLKDNGLFGWDSRYFRRAKRGVIAYENHVPVVPPIFGPYLEQQFGPPRRAGEELTQKHKDLAASVQRVTEELFTHILRHLQRRTGLKNVCVAGGVAQNSVANGKIIGSTGFEKLYIPSASHDAGISMGSASYLYHHVLGRPRTAPVYSAYTGAQFTMGQIEAFLQERGMTYRRYDDAGLYEVVTDTLIAKGVVGWFTGRAEFGPRALGGRSVLADPRNPDAKELLNAKIKRRESFRPFAPSILHEYVAEYFEKVEDVPFMEKVFPIRPEKRPLIPAVTHVDGTGRLQTVRKEISPRYYALIERFRQKTGIPILLNTSFNENEPIVNSPAEALDCFLRTNMDLLVLENFVLAR